MIVDGKFDNDLKDISIAFRGSTNQNIWEKRSDNEQSKKRKSNYGLRFFTAQLSTRFDRYKIVWKTDDFRRQGDFFVCLHRLYIKQIIRTWNI